MTLLNGGGGDRPTIHAVTTPRAAGGVEPILVHVALVDDGVDARHEVVVVVAGVGVVDEVAELLAVRRAPPRVGVEDHVAGGCVELDLRREVGAVGGEGPSVDLQDQGIALPLLEPRRLHDPALDGPTVHRRGPPDLLHRTQLLVGQEVLVETGEAPGLAAGTDQAHVGGMLGSGEGVGDGPARRDGE